VSDLPEQPASDAADAVTGGRFRRRAPRNYLARGERRRVFWLFMPPAIALVLLLSWVEHVWFPRRVPPAPPRIDTSLEAVQGPRPEGDTVLIEQEPEPFVPPAEELGASPTALARVRDDSYFRKEEEEAWIQTWLTLRSGDPRSFSRSAAREVSFSELFGQPVSFRGRLVRVRGTLKRLERIRAPRNDYDVAQYYEGWLEPADGVSAPIVLHFMQVPDGMPLGLKIDEPIEAVGYFFKRYAYNARDKPRVAPLVMALQPSWTPKPELQPGGTSLGTLALATMGAIVGATALAVWLANRRPSARAVAQASGLNDALADVEPFSVRDALGRLAGASPDRSPSSAASEESS
jgi:hypothetical protein